MKAKTIIGGAVLAASVLTGPAVAGSFSANIGVSSNYIFRGVTQTADQAAVSGGVDYEHDSGFYAGTWISNVTGYGGRTTSNTTNYEQDWYAGYGFEAGPVGLDVGYILFTYPVGDGEHDYGEIYVNASWEWLSGGINYTVNKEGNPDKKNDIYLFVSGETEIGNGLALSGTVGRYDYDDDTNNEDYTHFQLAVSKDDFTFAIDKNDLDGASGSTRFSVSWSKSFDL